MKIILNWAAAAFFVAAPLASVNAVEVVNEDDSDYVLFIEDCDAVVRVIINAGATLKLDCLTCIVGRENGNTVEAVEEEVIVIRAGQLSVEG